MTIRELNRDEVTNLANRTQTATAVFRHLSNRQRNRDETNLRRLKHRMEAEGFKVVPKELEDLFRELAKVGIGELRNGTFKWHFGVKEVARIPLEDGNGNIVSFVKKLKTTPVKATEQDSTKMVIVCLNTGGRSAQIKLPFNLSESEARTLADIILQIGK